MKYVVIVILIGLIAIPLASWILYGYDWVIGFWFALLAVLAGVVITVYKVQGKKLW